MEALVETLNDHFANENVVILGDFNVAKNGGAYGEISTWGVYDDLDSDGEPDFYHAGGSVENQTRDDIDHILISNELKGEWDFVGSDRNNQVFDTRISDHLPVVTRLNLSADAENTTSIELKGSTDTVRIFPNPLATGNQLSVYLPKNFSDVYISVLSVDGKVLLTEQRVEGSGGSIYNLDLPAEVSGNLILNIRNRDKSNSYIFLKQ